jgi:hypothetical protein
MEDDKIVKGTKAIKIGVIGKYQIPKRNDIFQKINLVLR